MVLNSNSAVEAALGSLDMLAIEDLIKEPTVYESSPFMTQH
jgi:hypothetical protein